MLDAVKWGDNSGVKVKFILAASSFAFLPQLPFPTFPLFQVDSIKWEWMGHAPGGKDSAKLIFPPSSFAFVPGLPLFPTPYLLPSLIASSELTAILMIFCWVTQVGQDDKDTGESVISF